MKRRSSKSRAHVGFSVALVAGFVACGGSGETGATGSGASGAGASSSGGATNDTNANSGAGAGNTAASASTGMADCDGGPCNTPPPGLLNPDFTTQWNPGILADTPTGHPLGPDGLPVRSDVCMAVPSMGGDATSAIQGALDGCAGKHQVVTLAAGTYSISATLNIPSGVVLRGAGTGASGTTIVTTQGGPVVSIGGMQDQACYDSSFDAEPLLTEDAAKETSTLTVADGSMFAAGDLALVDQMDTSEIDEGDCTFFKRVDHYTVSQRVEIASVSGDTLTLTTPLHWTFTTAQAAQVSRMATPAVKWAGLESVRLQGGRPGGYPGQNAGGVDMSNAAYCWIKDVEIDGTTAGMPVRLTGTYRSVVRDSHVHNSASYGFAQDNYGIVLACGAADDLIENNVARFMNKPILLNNSGGGNVIAYNYADNSWACDGNNDDGYQEVSIDSHCSFPHMELIEGNWAPHMGATTTHGNAGYLTFFRNFASSQWSPSDKPGSAIIWSQPFVPQYANVGAIDFPGDDVKMTVVGNVLGSTTDASLGLPMDLGTTAVGQGTGPATSQVYFASDGDGPAILLVDKTTPAWATLWLTGNFDTVNKKIMWNASMLTASLPASTQTLPASLYLTARPGWWPAGEAWPWAGPDLTPRVGALPAKDLSSSFSYDSADDPSCNLDCANYCCSTGASCSL